MLDQQNDNDINIARNKFNDFLNTLEYTYEWSLGYLGNRPLWWSGVHKSYLFKSFETSTVFMSSPYPSPLSLSAWMSRGLIFQYVANPARFLENISGSVGGFSAAGSAFADGNAFLSLSKSFQKVSCENTGAENADNGSTDASRTKRIFFIF